MLAAVASGEFSKIATRAEAPCEKKVMHKLVISVLGPDRPGIIAAVSRTLLEADGNIENVAQTILQSEFSGTFIVSVPGDVTATSLQQQLAMVMAPLNMKVYVKHFERIAANPRLIEAEPFVITTRGPDAKGLVAAMAEIIAAHGANVTNLQAVFKGGSDPDRNIMIYEVDVPKDVDQGAFYKQLRERAAQLNLKISIQHRNIFRAINRV